MTFYSSWFTFHSHSGQFIYFMYPAHLHLETLTVVITFGNYKVDRSSLYFLFSFLLYLTLLQRSSWIFSFQKCLNMTYWFVIMFMFHNHMLELALLIFYKFYSCRFTWLNFESALTFSHFGYISQYSCEKWQSSFGNLCDFLQSWKELSIEVFLR